MRNKKGREKVIQSLLRQQNVQLEQFVRDHTDAKSQLELASRSYGDVRRELGEIEGQIREATKEGEALSVDMLQWQRRHLEQRSNLLTDKKSEKDQASEFCDEKYKDLVGQKQKIESFEKLAEKYQADRKKTQLKTQFREQDDLSAQNSTHKR